MEIGLHIAESLSWAKLLSRPIVVAGPCSAENEAQVIDLALELAATKRVSLLRAGIWKPRTRPDSFSGVGRQALPWLVAASQKSGLPVATEVATASHVDLCLKAGIDVLWIGARTTVNPFYVQEIADALRGVDIPVMVKNPINPDLGLWIGALERLNRVGITQLAAVHRGFSSMDQTVYRNAPRWELAVEIKRRIPNLPIICDPSHIAGKSALVKEVAQTAMDLDMPGLMIEVHGQPNRALSDAAQQITPTELIILLESLTIRESNSPNISFQYKLAILRKEIDSLDIQLLELISKRIAIVEQIGYLKLENNVAILQLERWQEICQTRMEYGRAVALDESMVYRLFEIIHSYALKSQGSEELLRKSGHERGDQKNLEQTKPENG